MGYLIATCLFFGTIFYCLIRLFWKKAMPKTSRFKLSPLPGILLISATLLILLYVLIVYVIHVH